MANIHWEFIMNLLSILILQNNPNNTDTIVFLFYRWRKKNLEVRCSWSNSQ